MAVMTPMQQEEGGEVACVCVCMCDMLLALDCTFTHAHILATITPMQNGTRDHIWVWINSVQ
jgi:hypothetical protein